LKENRKHNNIVLSHSRRRRFGFQRVFFTSLSLIFIFYLSFSRSFILFRLAALRERTNFLRRLLGKRTRTRKKKYLSRHQPPTVCDLGVSLFETSSRIPSSKIGLEFC